MSAGSQLSLPLGSVVRVIGHDAISLSSIPPRLPAGSLEDRAQNGVSIGLEIHFLIFILFDLHMFDPDDS